MNSPCPHLPEWLQARIHGEARETQEGGDCDLQLVIGDPLDPVAKHKSLMKKAPAFPQGREGKGSKKVVSCQSVIPLPYALATDNRQLAMVV